MERDQFTKSVARELASRGITCNAVAPGFIETDMTAVISPEMRAELLKKIPLNYLGHAKDSVLLRLLLEELYRVEHRLRGNRSRE